MILSKLIKIAHNRYKLVLKVHYNKVTHKRNINFTPNRCINSVSDLNKH